MPSSKISSFLKIFHSISEFVSNARTVVTLGTFDGVHIGHRKILERLQESAQELKAESLVLTFFPHPRMVFNGDSSVELLNTMEEKASLLEKTGLDNLVIHPFSLEFAQLTAEEFVKQVLVDQFKVKKVIIGHDHRFGRNGSGDINDLIRFGSVYGFEVEQISPQEIGEVTVSSTKVRKALKEGDVALANEYLGYPYFLSGTVVKGKQLGRTINFPTANLQISESYKLIPQQGVYAVTSLWQDKMVSGMMNIGTNPTVGGSKLSVEIHFFDFNQDLYGQKLVVSLWQRIRSEQKFESVAILQQQLAADEIAARKILQTVVNL